MRGARFGWRPVLGTCPPSVALLRSGPTICSKGWRTLTCPTRSKLQDKSVGARPYRHWGPRDCHCPSQAARPQFPRGQLPTFRATKEMISHLVRRKSRTSAWRPSMSLTRKTSEPAQTYSWSVTAVTAAMGAIMGAEAAVASALGWAALAGGGGAAAEAAAAAGEAFGAYAAAIGSCAFDAVPVAIPVATYPYSLTPGRLPLVNSTPARSSALRIFVINELSLAMSLI